MRYHYEKKHRLIIKQRWNIGFDRKYITRDINISYCERRRIYGTRKGSNKAN